MYCSVCVCVCGLVCVWCMYCSVCMYVCGLVCVWEYVLYTHSTHKWFGVLCSCYVFVVVVPIVLSSSSCCSTGQNLEQHTGSGLYSPDHLCATPSLETLQHDTGNPVK